MSDGRPPQCHNVPARLGPGRWGCCLALACLWVAQAHGQSDAPLRLIAGEPKVLKHPPINKSVGNPVHCLTFVDGGARLVTGATSGLLVWDVKSGELMRTLDADQRAVDRVAIHPQGTVLVSGGASGAIQVWDTHSFEPIRVLGETSGAVQDISISPDGTLLASANAASPKAADDSLLGIVVWELATGRQVRSIAHPAPAFGSTALAFLPDGKQLITAQDRVFRLIDVEGEKVVKTVELPQLPRSLGALALAADGTRLLTGAFEPRLRLWETQSWQEVLAWDAHDHEPPPRRGVSAVNFSPDGRLALSGGMDGMVCVWDATSGRRLLKLDGRGEESGKWITGVVMSPDGKTLAASHHGGTATIWPIDGMQ